jgi:serine/threonine protein kinase
MCNALHEMDFLSNFRTGDLEYIDSGGFNDLFHYIINDDAHASSHGSTQNNSTTITEFAIKILSLETKSYTPHNYQIVRQDAIIQERLTSSPYIFPIYGYCGFALILPYVSGGTLSSNLRKWRKGEMDISSKQRLRYAVDMARGLRDLHDIDGDGIPSVTHGDLKEQQYLITENGGLQLGDFNKGEFLYKSQSTGETCPYRVPPHFNDKVFRSPEEYAYKDQTAATDVWALGSLMYYLLTGARVWREIAETHTELVRRYIIQGKKPEMEERILNSRDPVDIALKKAYDMACVYEPEKRASAREISDYLEGVWEELGY